MSTFFSVVGNRLAEAGRTIGQALLTTVVGGFRATGQALWQVVSGVGQMLTGCGCGTLLQGLYTLVGPAVMAGLQTVSAIQTLLGVEQPGRRLTAAERKEAYKVFGDTLDYDEVRIKQGGSGLLTAFSDRPWCLGHTIYLPTRGAAEPRSGAERSAQEVSARDETPRVSTVIHELVHAWQHQHGGVSYLSSSMYAQTLGDGYDFIKGIDQGRPFSRLSSEQQAKLVESAHAAGYFDGKRPLVVQGRDLTAYLAAAVDQIRRGAR